MNKSLKITLLITCFLIVAVSALMASLDSKTDGLKDLGEPDYVALAEVEAKAADAEEATLYIKEDE